MTWISKAQQLLQTHARKHFAAWCATDAGRRWRSNPRKSPYARGFTLPDYHHDLIAAVGRGDEVTAKWLMLAHYLDDHE